MTHRDINGAELHVGDLVRYGNREGTILILEDWDKLGGPSSYYPREGVYVSGIGTWGDNRAVPANRVEKIG